MIRKAENRDISGIMALLLQVNLVHHRGRPDLFKGPTTKYTADELAAILCSEETPVFVATDDNRIFREVERFGGRAVMTSTNHRSGTDRIEEAVEKIASKADIVINVQGDEPFIQPSQIETLCRQFDDPTTQIATLGKPFSEMAAVENENSPKIVLDNNGFALYFSRSVIPFVRGVERGEWLEKYPFLKHIGLYAYRREVLREITQLPPSSLEQAESLEQLRWLQNGYRIRVGLTDVETIGIDTPDDLKKAVEFLKL